MCDLHLLVRAGHGITLRFHRQWEKSTLSCRSWSLGVLNLEDNKSRDRKNVLLNTNHPLFCLSFIVCYKR